MTDNLQKRQTDDNFDGTESLGDHLIKCKYVTQSNGWTDKVESTASVSDVFQEQVGIKFAEMKDQLELRFEERHCAQTYYTRFMNRRQKPGEDFVTLATDLDRLSRLLYPECSLAIQDKIAGSHFIVALSDNFVRMTLQLKGVTSLRDAVRRSLILKEIQMNSFVKTSSSMTRKFQAITK